MGLLAFIFGAKKSKIESFIKNDAVILDVRTQREWDNGHIENSKHIPLNELKNRIEEIKSLNKPIITCCESGVRSGSAAAMLRSHRIEVLNGGGWHSLSNKL